MALRCEMHTAYIYDRGGMNRIARLDQPSKVEWSRIRDDISSASVVIQAPTADCAQALADIASGRHELVIFRGADRVWEGPITRLTYTSETVEVNARDVGHYLYRTVMRAGYDNGTVNAGPAITRIETICNAELARKEALDPPINVLPHMVFHHNVDDARTSRVTLPRQSTVWEDMDSLAHRGGLDYSTIGRAIHLFDTDRSLGRTPVLSEADFIGDVIVTEYGMDLATETTATDGRGVYGVAGGLDPYYGWVEMLHTAYDEETDDELPTQTELDDQALRNLNGRNPAPIEVRVPDNSTLNPNGALTIDMLVPGVHVPLRATLSGRKMSQLQKLSQVKVVETPTGEKITVTLVPAAVDDDIVDL